MLQGSVTVGRSAIHGLGVFAAEPIGQGTVVWRFTPSLDLDLDPAIVHAQPPSLRERLLHSGYVDWALRRFILCCDDARVLNHSPCPNLLTDRKADRHGVNRAARDSAAGEELTVDYAQFERPWQAAE